jgi:hypothetical protein
MPCIPQRHHMDFLNFRVEEVDDRVSSLEAMASPGSICTRR